MTDSVGSTPRPRLCLVGPMIGRTPGYVTTQGEILTDLLREAGYAVISTSEVLNRYARFFDILRTLLAHRQHYDVLLIQTYGGPSFVVEDVASWIGRRLGKRIVFHLRGGAMPEFMERHARWARRVLSRGDALVTPSRYLARAIEAWGFHAHVIPNVVNLSAYPYRHRATIRPAMLWMRSFHSIYNPMMAVRVLAKLRTEFPDATLVMAGQEKGMLRAVQDFARTLGTEEAIRFAGFLDVPAKVREGNAADIFINTTNIDNMPVAVVEAWAMGMPVVSTDVGGVPDLLSDGETGLLVPPDDDDSMVRAVVRLLRDHDLAGKLSRSGRSMAESCASERVLPHLERVIALSLQAKRKKEAD